MSQVVSPSLTSNLRQNYWISVTVLVVLAVINFSLFTVYLESTQKTRDFTFFTGKIRVLSVQAALVSNALVHESNLTMKRQYNQQLVELLQDMKSRHQTILNPMNDPGNTLAAFRKMYVSPKRHIRDQVENIIQEATTLSHSTVVLQTPGNSSYQAIQKIVVQGAFVNQVNQLLTDFHHLANENVTRLKWINYLTFSGSMLVLILLSLLVYRPLYKRVITSSERLEESNHILKKILDEQVAIQRSLQASESRFRALADSVPSAIWLTNVENSCEYLNRYWLDFTGKPLTSQLGTGWLEEIHPEGREILLNSFATREDFSFDCRIRHQDGEYDWFQLNAVPRYDLEDQFIGYVGGFVSISFRKQQELSLRQITEKLASANQELQDFSVIASHDLQEPLRKLIAFSERLQASMGSNLPDDARQYIERMNSAIVRMQNLINELLNYSRVTTKAKPFERVNLNQVMAEVLTDLELRIQQQKATIDMAELPTLQADQLQMYQLFQNLVSNALKYAKQDSPPHVRISAVTASYSDKTAFDLSSLPRMNYWIITVKDNGIGFEPQYSTKIFNPFQRLHGRNEYEGTGMGLAICRKIIDRHQGKIIAQSGLGEGSQFHVILPAA